MCNMYNSVVDYSRVHTAQSVGLLLPRVLRMGSALLRTQWIVCMLFWTSNRAEAALITLHESCQGLMV